MKRPVFKRKPPILFLFFVFCLMDTADCKTDSVIRRTIHDNTVEYKAIVNLLKCKRCIDSNEIKSAVDSLASLGQKSVPMLLKGLEGRDNLLTALLDTTEIAFMISDPVVLSRGISSCNECAFLALKKMGRNAVKPLIKHIADNPQSIVNSDILSLLYLQKNKSDIGMLNDLLNDTNVRKNPDIISCILCILNDIDSAQTISALKPFFDYSLFHENIWAFCVVAELAADHGYKEYAREKTRVYLQYLEINVSDPGTIRKFVEFPYAISSASYLLRTLCHIGEPALASDLAASMLLDSTIDKRIRKDVAGAIASCKLFACIPPLIGIMEKSIVDSRENSHDYSQQNQCLLDGCLTAFIDVTSESFARNRIHDIKNCGNQGYYSFTIPTAKKMKLLQSMNDWWKKNGRDYSRKNYDAPASLALYKEQINRWKRNAR